MDKEKIIHGMQSANDSDKVAFYNWLVREHVDHSNDYDFAGIVRKRLREMESLIDVDEQFDYVNSKIDEAAENRRKNRGRLSLLNYEGDVLWMARTDMPGQFVVYDQDDFIVDIYTMKEILEWFDGDRSMYDSMGREWKYTEVPLDSKVRVADFFTFAIRGL